LTPETSTLSLGQGDSAVEVLRGIDLEVPQGQTLALLGPSGSGKSSLMAVLSGLERASGGTLTVAGENFAALDEDALAAPGAAGSGLCFRPSTCCRP
jgi:putative ABC transport system ATP-binding protein